VPVILDWDRRCPFVDQKTVFNPGVGEGDLWGGFGSGDASTIAALISLAEAFVGIDSGPGKIASATQTPSLILWKDHLPIQFHDPAENTVHLIREDYARLPPCVGRQAIADYMLGHYQCRTYRGREHLLLAARDWLLWNLDCEITPMGFFGELRSSSYNRDYYLEHKEAGLDYLEYGDWQREYGRWLVGALGLKEKNGLDVGCACGSVLRGLGEAGAFVTGVDLCEPMIALGREKWPDMASLLNVCDACNLHHFADASFDFLHCAQVAEHWKPALVPEILRELRRVTRPGGLFFCCLDTEELFARQGRKVEHEDPTHVCVRPMAWWMERLGESGWDDATGEYDGALGSPPDSFLKRYDWAWFVARKAQP
jgi:SAM-dependent methyltransferase